MKKIYLDTEFMYDGMFHEKRLPTDTDKKQIIQISAILFDHETGKEVASYDTLVKPIFHENLPDFFIELTHITEDDVQKQAIPFTQALEKLVKFCQGYEIVTFNNDYHVFEQNCEFHSIDNPFKTPFTRVKPQLKEFGIDPDKYSSGTLYKSVGLNLTGHVHNALHDVRSMGQSMHILKEIKKNQ